jgi:hypothetical protein
MAEAGTTSLGAAVCQIASTSGWATASTISAFVLLKLLNNETEIEFKYD